MSADAGDGEVVAWATTAGHEIVVTDTRLDVLRGARSVLSVDLADLRRVEFDIERGQSSSLVLVPDRLSDQLQVLNVAPDELQAIADVIVALGDRIHDGAA